MKFNTEIFVSLMNASDFDASFPNQHRSQEPITRSCTVHTYTALHTVVRLYLVLPVAVVGIAANAVNVLVFLNRRMRHAVINWFLLALSLSDLCLLMCTILFVSMPVVTTIDGDHWLWLVKLQVYLIRFGYSFGIIFRMASVYYTTLVCIYRYIAVCYPLRARQLTTKRSAKCAITFAAICSLSINVCRFWEITLEPCVAPQYNDAILAQITISGLGANAVYRVAFTTVIYPLITSILPFFILLALTVMMKRAMHCSQRLHSQQRNMSMSAPYATQQAVPRRPACSVVEMTPVNQSQTSTLNSREGKQMQRKVGMSANRICSAGSVDGLNIFQRRIRSTPVMLMKTSTELHVSRDRGICQSGSLSVESTSHEGRVTTMLLIIVGVFFLCNSVPFVNNILEILLRYQPQLNRTVLRQLFHFGIEIGNLLVAFNSASTIVIYLIFSSKYVDALQSVMSGLSTESPPVVNCGPAIAVNDNTERQPLLAKRIVPDDGLSTTNGSSDRISSIGNSSL